MLCAAPGIRSSSLDAVDCFFRVHREMDLPRDRHRGLLTADDFSRWSQATVEDPITYDYYGYTVLKNADHGVCIRRFCNSSRYAQRVCTLKVMWTPVPAPTSFTFVIEVMKPRLRRPRSLLWRSEILPRADG